MLREGLTGHLLIYQGEKFMFNYKEAILSLLPICDEFVICECFSDDGTYEECLALARQYPEIRIIRHPWQSEEEEKGYEYRRLARLTDLCTEESRTKWFGYIQGDECLHEDGLEEIKYVVRRKEVPNSPRAISIPYHHFVCNMSTTWPFVYQSSIRFGWKDSTWRALEDAWTLRCSRKEDALVYPASHARMFHYGFALGGSMARMQKEKNLQLAFQALGFPDPKVIAMADGDRPVSNAYLFQDAKDKGLFKPFTGTHPAVMKQWIEDHRQYEEVFA